MYNELISLAVQIGGIIALLAIVVAVIIEVIKGLPLLEKIPTQIVVIIVALIVTISALFIYCAWKNITILWYYIILAIFASFFVAIVASSGWQYLIDIISRYIPTNKEK